MDGKLSIRYCNKRDASALKKHIEELRGEGACSLAILACEADQWAPEDIDSLLTALSVPVFGGIFPSVIYQYRHYTAGTILIGFENRMDVVLLENLTTNEALLHADIYSKCAHLAKAGNLITFVDGLSSNIERFVSSLYTLIGPNSNIIGGGAGTLDFIQKPCLFSNKGLLQDAACIVDFPFDLHSSIQHGWEILKGPYLVSEAGANLVKSLNYQPAFDVYRDLVEVESGELLDDSNFFNIAKTYPLGIEDMHGKILVRDPIRVKNRQLVCVGAVPENSMVYILKGRRKKLVESARLAAKEACASYTKNGIRGHRPGAALLMDCVSRVLFLREAFNEEMSAIEKELGASVRSFGALTLGEIANTRNSPVNLLNKSTVVGVF